MQHDAASATSPPFKAGAVNVNGLVDQSEWWEFFASPPTPTPRRHALTPLEEVREAPLPCLETLDVI